MASTDPKDEPPKMDRRTWDKALYAQKALERIAALEAGEDPDRVDPADTGLFLEAPADLPRVPGSQRAFLQTRGKGINFDKDVGTRKVSFALDCCTGCFLKGTPTDLL